MSVSVPTVNHALDLYRAYALLEKEQNLLMLLAELAEDSMLSDEISAQVSKILYIPKTDVIKKQERERILKERADSVRHVWSSCKDKKQDLFKIIDGLKKTDEELTHLKKSDKKLAEHIDEKRITLLRKEKFHKMFANLVSNRTMVAVGLADPSYMLYISPGSGDGGSSSVGSYQIVEKLKSLAQTLSNAHILVAAQAVFGAAGIINVLVSELYSANKLQKRLNALNLQGIGINLRYQKNILIGSLFVIRAIVLGVSVGLTAAAITTPVGAATLLLVALSSYLVEEFRHLQIERNTLNTLHKQKSELEAKIGTLVDKSLDAGLSVTERIKVIDILRVERQKLGETEGAIAIVEEKVAETVGRRNKTMYNAIGAALIIISPLVPPLFFVGVSMLAIPLVVGAARYADEKWNHGKLSNAIINSAVGQFVIDSKPYKKMFGDKPSQHKELRESSDLSVNVSTQQPVTEPEAEKSSVRLEAEDLVLKGKEHLMVHSFNDAIERRSEEAEKLSGGNKSLTEEPDDTITKQVIKKQKS